MPTLRLAVDPREAVAGAKQAESAIKKVADQAKRTEAATKKAAGGFSALGSGVRNASYQIADVAVQMQYGVSAMRAMSVQLPQLLAGFGVFGAIAGAVAAVGSALFMSMTGAQKAKTAVEQLGDVDLGGIRGATSDLLTIQNNYNKAIAESGNVSSSSANLVVANSQKEFEARKMVLRVERDLLRLRSQDQIQALENLKRQQELFAADAMKTLEALGPRATFDPSKEAGGFAGASLFWSDIEISAAEHMKSLRANRQEILLLEAELLRLGIASDEAEEALAMVFDATGSAAAGVAANQYGGGGSAAAQAVREIREELEDMTSVANTIEKSMTSGFMSIIDGTKSAKDAFRDMARDIIAELYRVLVVKQLVGSWDSGTGSGTGIVGMLMGGLGGLFGRASGGPVDAGKPYIVGERGPEVFTPSTNGRISNGGGGGVTIIQNNTFGNGVSRAEIQSMLPRIVETTKAAVFDAQRRSVNGLGYA